MSDIATVFSLQSDGCISRHRGSWERGWIARVFGGRVSMSSQVPGSLLWGAPFYLIHPLCTRARANTRSRSRARSRSRRRTRRFLCMQRHPRFQETRMMQRLAQGARIDRFHVTSLPPCWRTITKDSSSASIVSSSNMATTSLWFEYLRIDYLSIHELV